MANMSAFGISGFDPAGTMANGFLTGHISDVFGAKASKRNMQQAKEWAWFAADQQRKMMNFQSDLNQKNQVWAANTMPKETVTGLRRANLNPLLAYSDFSGLASSGAMGVTPSSVPGGPSGQGMPSIDYGSGTSGFGKEAVEYFKGLGVASSQRRAAKNDAETNEDVSEIRRRQAPVNAALAMDADASETAAKEQKAKNDLMEEQLRAFLLARETSVTTGRVSNQTEHAPVFQTGSDEANQFWNDFYREKLDLQKYMNSALRQKTMDAIHMSKEAAGAVSEFIPTKHVKQVIFGRKPHH